VELPPIRRRSVALGVLLGLLVLVAPLALLIRGARPETGNTGPAIGVLPTASRLAPSCARMARDPEGLGREYSAATPGQTVCLTSGNYGKFFAGRKSGPVGIRAQHGAKVRIALDFDAVINLRIDNVTVTSAVIGGASQNITIANSRFTGLALVRADQLENSNIVFDHNVHANIDTCTDCFQGRLHVDGNTGRPSGVVIKNSVFSGGNSDGVRADADGIKVIDNEFFGFRDQNPFHTDPVQIYGGSNVVLRGNYFHDNAVSAQIMMADGGAHNLVEDNVISGTGYTWAITWFSDKGSIIRHNSFADGRCNDNIRCGMLNLGAKATDPVGEGTIIRDNVMGGISNGGEGKTSRFVADHNLTALSTPGSRNVTGLPRFRGPLGKYGGYRLAPGSPGARLASNGSNPGIR